MKPKCLVSKSLHKRDSSKYRHPFLLFLLLFTSCHPSKIYLFLFKTVDPSLDDTLCKMPPIINFNFSLRPCVLCRIHNLLPPKKVKLVFKIYTFRSKIITNHPPPCRKPLTFLKSKISQNWNSVIHWVMNIWIGWVLFIILNLIYTPTLVLIIIVDNNHSAEIRKLLRITGGVEFRFFRNQRSVTSGFIHFRGHNIWSFRRNKYFVILEQNV